MEAALAVATKLDDVDEIVRLTDEIALVNKTMKPITAGDKFYMFMTGNFPEPLEGAGKLEEMLYFVGNTLAESDSKFLKGWQRFNPFSLTPEARVHEWTNRIDGYISSHVLAQGDDPAKIVKHFEKLAAQATSGKLSSMAATPDGRLIQSYLRSSELSATQLLGDYMRTAGDGQVVMSIARRLGVKAPNLLDDILAGKGSTIAKRLAGMGDEGSLIAQQLTPDVLTRLGKLKGTPYTQELFKRMLHNQILDDLARIGIVQFGLESRGLIQKWTAFLKAGETLAFLRINPTFAARNWINNEFTMIARGVGGDFFGSGLDDLAALVDKLNFTPLRANQAFTMAGMEADTIGKIGEAASRRISSALQGDVIFLDKWAKKISDAKLGIFDFGSLAQRSEAAASRKALTKGYTRAWREFWTPDAFTSASKFLPQNVIRELGEDAVRQLDNILADASSLKDIDNILANIDKIDLNKSATGIFREIEDTLGIKLSHQFEEFELEKLRAGMEEALNAKTTKEVRDIFDDLHRTVIKKIEDEAEVRLATTLEKFENAVDAERGMALLGVTEEITNQLDVFEYLYSSGMARFRPDDVSKVVRDAYWPMWLDEQTRFWKVKYDRIDAAINGVRNGGKNIDLNLDQALKNLENKKKIWNNFFEKRNKMYDDFFKAQKVPVEGYTKTWDELVDEIDVLYKIAADTDIASIKQTDDLMEAAIRINNPELADGFAGWRAEIRAWKIKDRAQTRTYAYMQKKGELPIDSPTYRQFWAERNNLQAELGELRNRGYAMMEGNTEELAYFSGLVDESTQVIRVAKVDDVVKPTIDQMTDFAKKDLMSYEKVVSVEEYKNGFIAIVEDTDNKEFYGIILDNSGSHIGSSTQADDAKRALSKAKSHYETVADKITPISRVSEVDIPPSRQARQIALDLEGKATTLRAAQVSEPSISPMFPNEAKEEQWFSRNFWTLREMEEKAASMVGQPASRLDMSDFARDELGKFLNSAKREMADAQYGSVRMAEYYRDAALLNYNRKMNYDTWLGTFMPFEFWTTHSMGQWAIQSINRPAALSLYMRYQQMQDRISLEDPNFPTRLKGKTKIPIPPWLGMQEWMGDSLFVDVWAAFAPFAQMTMPYTTVVQRGLSNMGTVE